MIARGDRGHRRRAVLDGISCALLQSSAFEQLGGRSSAACQGLLDPFSFKEGFRLKAWQLNQRRTLRGPPGAAFPARTAFRSVRATDKIRRQQSTALSETMLDKPWVEPEQVSPSPY
jgi:hypothetical protein